MESLFVCIYIQQGLDVVRHLTQPILYYLATHTLDFIQNRSTSPIQHGPHRSHPIHPLSNLHPPNSQGRKQSTHGLSPPLPPESLQPPSLGIGRKYRPLRLPRRNRWSLQSQRSVHLLHFHFGTYPPLLGRMS